MKYNINYTSAFKKDLKKYTKKLAYFGYIQQCIKFLENGGNENIPAQMRPHLLIGNYKDCWECHIKPDLLLIWQQDETTQNISIIRVGSHSNLF
jgi:mRNA interferase YafQ